MNANNELKAMFNCENPINRLKAMCSAKDFLHSETHFEFKFANSFAKVNGVKVNHVKFIKTENTWTMVLGKIKKVKMFGVSIPEYNAIQEYVDLPVSYIKPMFEQSTGFFTSL